MPGDRRTLIERAALQGDLEDLLGCSLHVMTMGPHRDPSGRTPVAAQASFQFDG